MLDRQQGSQGPGCSPVKEWVAGVTAEPGEAGWNPVDAHTRRTSCRSPFDPIEGDAPRRGDRLVPGGLAGIPVATEANLTERALSLKQRASATPTVSANVRRKRPSSARRTAHQCAPLQLPAAEEGIKRLEAELGRLFEAEANAPAPGSPNLNVLTVPS
jgi:hypothetical protein